MMEHNICHFIPYDTHDETIHTLYFVYEQNFDALQRNQTLAFFKLCIVVSGKGTLTIYEKTYPLQKGDLFFIFPSVRHTICSVSGENDSERLKCIYISYIGIRANQIMTRFQITAASPVYSGHSDLIEFWENSIHLVRKNNLDIISESVLLYTLSVIGADKTETNEILDSNLLHNIKKYIDENFYDHNLSLNGICSFYHYNPKYISTMFKKVFHIGLNEYINTIRIHEACVLINDNMTSVKDIAMKCGYRDQYYFSRVFKSHIGMPPRQYILEHKSQRS